MNIFDKSSTKWILIGIILLGTSLRLWGIDFGLPYVYHPDEPNYVAIAQNIFKTGDLNPHWFNFPSLFYYLNAFGYVPYYLVGTLIGIFQNPMDISPPNMIVMGTGITTMPSTFLLGRIITTAFSVASIILVYLVGRQITGTGNTTIGLLSALMMAISSTNVENSRFITPDTFVVFFVMLSIFASVILFQRGETKYYIFAGIFSGLTAGAKYNGAMILISVFAAHFLRNGLKGFKDHRIYLTIILSGIIFLLTTPYAIFDFSKFFQDFQYETHHYSTGHTGMEGNTLRWYIEYLWQTYGIIAILAVFEILYGIQSRSKPIILLSTFPVVYFLFISSFVVRNARTLLPLTPFLFLLSASLLLSIYKSNIWILNKKIKIFIIGILVIVTIFIPFQQTLKTASILTTIDSRETARVWINENLPSGSRIGIEAYSPYVDPQRFAVKGFGRIIEHTPEWYVENGFDYIIFSQNMFGRFYIEPDRYSKEINEYDSLFNSFQLIRKFTDGGYEVRIYRVVI